MPLTGKSWQRSGKGAPTGRKRRQFPKTANERKEKVFPKNAADHKEKSGNSRKMPPTIRKKRQFPKNAADHMKKAAVPEKCRRTQGKSGSSQKSNPQKQADPAFLWGCFLCRLHRRTESPVLFQPFPFDRELTGIAFFFSCRTGRRFLPSHRGVLFIPPDWGRSPFITGYHSRLPISCGSTSVR